MSTNVPSLEKSPKTSNSRGNLHVHDWYQKVGSTAAEAANVR